MENGKWKVNGFVLVMLMLMAACSSFPPASGRLASTDPSLASIDSLLWTHPDSAFAQLQAFAESHEVDSLDTFNRHYFHLLLSELLYKNDYAQTNRNELLQALGYYDSLVDAGGNRVHPDLAFLDARSHYIDGVGYYEMDSAVAAFEQYLKAVEIMEDHFSEEELVGKKAQFMALAYTHLTKLFSDQYLHEHTILLGKQSLLYFHKYAAKPWHVSWMLDLLGAHYDMLAKYDSADYYYHKALDIISDTNGLPYRDITSHIAFLSYEKGGDPQKAITRMTNLLSMVGNEKELMSRYLTIGEIYYHEKEYDSAKVYLTNVYDKTSNLSQKKQAAEWLSVIFKELDEQDASGLYAEFLVPFANQKENLSARKTAIIHHYELFIQDEQDRLYQRKREQNTKWTLLLIGGLVIAMSIFALNNKISKNKRKGLELQNQVLSDKLKKKNRKLQKVKSQTGENKEDTESYNSFLNTPICRHILDITHNNVFKSKVDYSAYAAFALRKDEILALRAAANENMRDLTVRLKEQIPGLNDEDVTYCCLYLLNLSDAEVAALMQRAYPTVCERRRKIKHLVGKDKDIIYVLCHLH